MLIDIIELRKNKRYSDCINVVLVFPLKIVCFIMGKMIRQCNKYGKVTS